MHVKDLLQAKLCYKDTAKGKNALQFWTLGAFISVFMA